MSELKTQRKPGERRCTRCKQYSRYTKRWHGGVYCPSCVPEGLGKKRVPPGMAQLAELSQVIQVGRGGGRPWLTSRAE